MKPILYSFRRCPYAIRARLAIASAGVPVELREILLRDKPAAFLDASPSATVPCLVSNSGVLDESLDVMTWALGQSDPEDLLNMPDAGHDLIQMFDGPFKRALDLTKYAVRHPDSDPDVTRADAMKMLATLEDQLADGWLFGARPTLADLAALPFVRQFANIDKPRFDTEATRHVSAWLETFLASDRLNFVMRKYAVWAEGDAPVTFP
ncbi:Glutathione S-transferase [Aliiroseovarius halocynthiae]|uniref:Glutathione S-transferase n=1 Tax=Aliiroseovarius halocynthiae TaxID=985055 RepID=A0A545SNV3_9RHOB|nr:glutathione S-transferase [Aliiroseovarius halocynthiae]TQV66662.1 glutathione S-transferase [Aliiroseovarius halocynthiae]SMR82461.1 Glutathione S-transferase [Aliiroseovarius halocynthiae]